MYTPGPEVIKLEFDLCANDSNFRLLGYETINYLHKTVISVQCIYPLKVNQKLSLSIELGLKFYNHGTCLVFVYKYISCLDHYVLFFH